MTMNSLGNFNPANDPESMVSFLITGLQYKAASFCLKNENSVTMKLLFKKCRTFPFDYVKVWAG